MPEKYTLSAIKAIITEGIDDLRFFGRKSCPIVARPNQSTYGKESPPSYTPQG